MWDFLLAAISGSVVTTALLAIAGVLGRSQLAHWLNKDMEQIKAQHQRELEAYKVGLIAETERAKALQSVKTAAALRSIERKFVVLEALHRTLQGHLSAVVAAVGVTYPDLARKLEGLDKCQANIQRLSDALDEAGAYLQPQEYLTVLNMHIAANALASEAAHDNTLNPIQIDEVRKGELAQLAIAAIAVPRRVLDAMLRMD